MDPMDVDPVVDLIDTELAQPVTSTEPVLEQTSDLSGLCETCIHTKQQQKVIRTKASRTTIPFELVHSDLCGPIKHSIGGAQYYIIYLDDCTRYTEVYFLVTKTAEEISTKFRQYPAWVENQGFRIKRFRSDNGSGEYSNSVFLGCLEKRESRLNPPPRTRNTKMERLSE
jgi:transposase InsO family protein